MTEPIPAGRKVVPIRWRDLDGFNHVNNAVFLNYLEEGRDAWLAAAVGAGPPTLNDFVVRHIAIDFVSQVTQDDGDAIVTIEVESVGTTSITLRESIHVSSDERLVASARSVLVHTDPAHTASQRLPDGFRARLEASLVS